jgi:hypothetical protein
MCARAVDGGGGGGGVDGKHGNVGRWAGVAAHVTEKKDFRSTTEKWSFGTWENW